MSTSALLESEEDAFAAAASDSLPPAASMSAQAPTSRLADAQSDEDDPRHLTYKKYVAYACLCGFLLFLGSMVSTLTVLPNAMIQWLNDGVSCDGAEAKHDDCKQATAHYTWLIGASGSVGCFLTFLGSPLLGTLSDSYGRKKPLLGCATATLIQQSALIAYAYAGTSLYVYLGLGILASFDATTLLLAYLSDTVPPSKRSLCFGLVFAASTTALIVGPFIGASLSMAATFMTSFGIYVAYWLLILCMPESLPVAGRPVFNRENLNPFKVFLVLGRFKMFQKLALVVLVNNFIERGKFAVNFSFLKYKFGMTSQYFAWIALTFGVLGMLVQSVVLKAMTRYLTNQRIMMVALVASLANTVMYAFVWEEWQIFVAEIPSTMSFLSFPAISAMKSNNVNSNEQGKIQGALFGIRQLGAGLGPVVYGAIFNEFTKDSAPYRNVSVVWWIASFFALLCVLLGSSVPAIVDSEEKSVYQAKAKAEEAEAAEARKAQQHEEAEALAMQIEALTAGGGQVDEHTGLKAPRYQYQALASPVNADTNSASGTGAAYPHLANRDQAW